ncbi:MAG: hypothetical protein GQ582_13695 [Methyloprofundus sp.]|nr:hypothetical protein [Methyloprofundus sp.]
MTTSFSNSETRLQAIFSVGKTFHYKNAEHTIIISGKPRPSSGECKTDLYIKTVDTSMHEHEIKISIKQFNADFIENKITLERAIQIFGNTAQDIIKMALQQIQSQFTEEPLILFNKFRRTEAKSIKIGWKFELLNKKSGDKSALINLTQKQIIDVYSGTNLLGDKRHANVNSKIINDSGIANAILFMDPNNHSKNLQDYANDIQDIKDYCRDKTVYFACKAINYRATPKKWDGNRPLAVWVDWRLNNDVLSGTLNFSAPLSMKANHIGSNIQSILDQLGINKDNFYELKDKLGAKVIYQ